MRRPIGSILSCAAFALANVVPAAASVPPPPCSTVATCAFFPDDTADLADGMTAALDADGSDPAAPAASIPVLAYASHAVSRIVHAADDVAADDAALVAALLGAPETYAAFGATSATSVSTRAVAARRDVAFAPNLPRF